MGQGAFVLMQNIIQTARHNVPKYNSDWSKYAVQIAKNQTAPKIDVKKWRVIIRKEENKCDKDSGSANTLVFGFHY